MGWMRAGLRTLFVPLWVVRWMPCSFVRSWVELLMWSMWRGFQIAMLYCLYSMLMAVAATLWENRVLCPLRDSVCSSQRVN